MEETHFSFVQSWCISYERVHLIELGSRRINPPFLQKDQPLKRAAPSAIQTGIGRIPSAENVAPITGFCSVASDTSRTPNPASPFASAGPASDPT